MRFPREQQCVSLMFVVFFLAAHSQAEPVPVRHPQGSAHGFLAVRTLDGKRIATGDAIQTVHRDRVTSHLVFRFRDGSIDDETTTFSQRGTFRLISDHHVQRGPSFPKPMDRTIDALGGEVTTRSENGKVTTEHLDLPDDVANGLPPNLLLNISPSASETKISFVAPTAKPRVVQLSIKRGVDVPFTIGDTRRKAIDYVVHFEIGGVAGKVAPIVGKQPADLHIWVLADSAPAFIREEGQLYDGGPLWRVEQISPTLPK